MSASRLQEAAHVLQVPIPFFFEYAPNVSGQANIDGNTPSSAHVFDFLATTEGLIWSRHSDEIERPALRHRIVALKSGASYGRKLVTA
jgi:hypothetical protein